MNDLRQMALTAPSDGVYIHPLGQVWTPESQKTAFAFGNIPVLLKPVCSISDEMMQDITILWATQPFPWEPLQGVIEDSLQHPEPRFRFAALHDLEQRALVRHRDQAAPEWLLKRLDTMVSDSDASVAAYARALSESLPQGIFPPAEFHRQGCE